MIEVIFENKEKLIKTINKTFKFPLRGNQQEVCIHGATVLGIDLKKCLESSNIKTICFTDNDSKKWNRMLDEIPIVSPKYKNENFYNIPLLISSLQYEEEILDSWKKRGVDLSYQLDFLHFKHPSVFNYIFFEDMFNVTYNNKDDIIKLYNDLHDEESKETLLNIVKYRLSFDKNYLKISKSLNEQYFEKDVLSFTDDEVIYDVGAYDGDTIECFLGKVTNNKYAKYYAFEPSNSYCEIIQNKKDQNINWKNVEIVNCGVYNKKSKVKAYDKGSSEFSDNILSIDKSIDSEAAGNSDVIYINTITIDEFAKTHLKPTFIKMDIEGAELNALIGAKNVIVNHKPKLAICIYHRPSDLSEIAKYIKQLNSHYRFYIRHYRDYICDTVLYCL